MRINLSLPGTAVLVGMGIVAACVAAQDGKQEVDRFAEIAAAKSDYQNRNLVPVTPPALPERVLPIDAEGIGGAFEPAPKITTAEQVREELARQREIHAPFLKDLAPSLEDQRIRVGLEEFDWRIETAEDRSDFSGTTLAGEGKWERVTIPHYGGPMGRAVTYYRTEFDVTPEMLEKGALYVHFNGVDYKANVFVNGTLLGSHEGFFAPFEFEFTAQARAGKNLLLVKVFNDFIMLGNDEKTGFMGEDQKQCGDKIYAATGPGWDDPEVGWHHCPPGMGIYQDVWIEARPRVFVQEVFVRPLPDENKAEAWIEVFGCDAEPSKIALRLSVFGQNFSGTILRDKTYAPAEMKISGAETMDLTVQPGVNLYKIPLSIPKPRLWAPDHPWLYQLQVAVLDKSGNLTDTARRQFGMRTFRMEYVEEPKGRMYLNGKGIKLRGANEMGAIQQDVMREDWKQLTDDILLAKITNMNYIRLTQRPVQAEIYDYCDRLGLLLQTDLPTFGVMGRHQFCELVRQAGEMERLVRSHPSNIMVTYINEPFPNAGEKPQKNLTREEMTRLFEAADIAVRMANPDRVIKAVDGDYDPPGPGLPDYHCYTAWYNGHGTEMGALQKGYWQAIKPGWGYGCGEFGAEGLDPVDLMRRRYPREWLPQSEADEKKWTPDRIVGAQTGKMHYYFFETPHTLDEWVARGQAHQAWATRLMTEAFRRASRMQSFAIHLFIDAFPSGWMKTIMDCERQPKPAWFAYHDALTPLAVSLRCDRRAFFAGEEMNLEAWVCNDRNDVPEEARLHYQLEQDGKVLQAGSTEASVRPLDSVFQGTVRLKAPEVSRRGAVTVRLGLLDSDGKVLHDNAVVLDVFPQMGGQKLRRVYVIGAAGGKADQLARDLGAAPVFEGPMQADDAILVDDAKAYAKVEKEVAEAVRGGAEAVFLELPAGKYQLGEEKVSVGEAASSDEPMVGVSPSGVHFVSRATGHKLVEGFQREDFKFWYDAKVDRPSPLLNAPTFKASGWEPILLSFERLAAGRKPDGKGHWCICQITLAGRTAGNPVAAIFARRLLSY